jgi:glycosyltransferase involved in cell wall biosynthesis
MVYFGMSPWEGMWKSRHQLMSRLSAEMPVLYVEPYIGLQSVRKGQVKLSRILADISRPLQRHEPNVTVFHTAMHLPVSGSSLLAGVTQGIWSRAVRRAMRSVGITRPIAWISRPERQFVMGKLGEILSIYHVVDEYAGYTGLDDHSRSRLAEIEAQVLDSVDLVIVASPELEVAKRGAGREIMVLENGVEPEEYAEARDSGIEPEDLARVPRPRIGYSGLIGKRLNLDLIHDVAADCAERSIVLVGKVDERHCEDAIARLRSLPNVYFLGEKPASKVASYIVGFDIGLLPYTINLETEHISPIKMYEYWAAGKPVISTAIPAARRHDFAVNVAESDDEFCSMVDRLIGSPSVDESERLIRLAEENSWQSRVDVVADELQARIGAGV